MGVIYTNKLPVPRYKDDEKKQYYIDTECEAGHIYINNPKGNHMSWKEVVDALNKLTDENGQLKKEIERITKDKENWAFISDCSVQVMNEEEKFKEDYLRIATNDLKKLQEENEQLKSKNQSWLKAASYAIRMNKENKELKRELEKFKEWEKHIGDVNKEELDRVFKMSIYEIAESFEYYKKRIETLEKELEE